MLNATVLAVASIILLADPANGRLPVLVAGFAALLVMNLLLMRRAVAPLSKLTTLVAQVDPPRWGARLPGEAMPR